MRARRAHLQRPAGRAYAGKWTVVVDDDIDAGELDQVLWAMCTRFDPNVDIDIIQLPGPQARSAIPAWQLQQSYSHRRLHPLRHEAQGRSRSRSTSARICARSCGRSSAHLRRCEVVSWSSPSTSCPVLCRHPDSFRIMEESQDGRVSPHDADGLVPSLVGCAR
jgi:hypothetical protein